MVQSTQDIPTKHLRIFYNDLEVCRSSKPILPKINRSKSMETTKSLTSLFSGKQMLSQLVSNTKNSLSYLSKLVFRMIRFTIDP